jgi:predicted nucleotidyltransferase component of viral defense system
MLQLEFLKNYYPGYLWGNINQRKYLIKEYIQLLILDYLTTTPFIRKITFIGGTNLRLVKGIDRFSEDLDFDCKNLLEEEFLKMADNIITFLQRNGLRVEVRDKPNEKLKAYRRNIYFPELLFELGLSGYKQERFLIKVEIQNQQIEYEQKMTTIKGCGLFFMFPVPTDDVLCAMKVSALLSRQKGRDFYDVMFLMAQTKPDYGFLSLKCGINNLEELKTAFGKMLQTVDLSYKAKDFEHLVFLENSTNKIHLFNEFVNGL